MSRKPECECPRMACSVPGHRERVHPSSLAAPVGPEALAQAREQLEAGFACAGWETMKENFVHERATVIELRRQLAGRDGDYMRAVDDAIALRAQLAAAEERAATKRQRAEAAERSRDGWHDRACKDAAGWKSTEVRLEASEKRAEAAEAAGRDQHDELQAVEERLEAVEKRADAAEAQLSEWVNWFQQKDPAKAYDIIANEHDAIRSARDQWHRDYCQASEERSDYQGKFAASEAKRKALREACVELVPWLPRIPEDVRARFEVVLAADGKDTPPEETCMRGVRDDSEHYT